MDVARGDLQILGSIEVSDDLFPRTDDFQTSRIDSVKALKPFENPCDEENSELTDQR